MSVRTGGSTKLGQAERIEVAERTPGRRSCGTWGAAAYSNHGHSLQTSGGVARADEIPLKDGKKLYGVIVAYEENMFKVKTDFGYVLVEKDKVASIIPSTPAKAAEKMEASAAKNEAAKRAPESDNVSVTDVGLPSARTVGAKTREATSGIRPRTPPAREAKAEPPAIKDGPTTKARCL